MSTKLSKSDARRTQILDLLSGGQQVQIKEIAEKLDVSLMTIHRDLAELEQNGAISRVRGAVSAEKSVLFESSFFFRSQRQIEEKKRLVRAALKYVTPGNALALDDSTTVAQIADIIQEVTPITVLTNGLGMINRLCTEPGVDVISLGGKYHRGFNGFFGLQCERATSDYIVDVSIMSTTTIQGTALFTQEEQVVRMKRIMLKIARKSILLVDSTKFTYSALNHTADLADFDHVIISSDTDPENLESLRTAGIVFELA